MRDLFTSRYEKRAVYLGETAPYFDFESTDEAEFQPGLAPLSADLI
jgi:hypothetical protein